MNVGLQAKHGLALLMGMLLAVVLAGAVYAAPAEPFYVGDGRAFATVNRSDGSYYGQANSKTDATNIVVTARLYEKTLFWYSEVDSCTASGSGKSCTASGSYSFKTDKDYKVEVSAALTYRDGSSETVTASATA